MSQGVFVASCLLFGLFSVPTIDAHPLGNFSIGQFTDLSLAPDGLHLHHVLDLAEMPTFFLRNELGVTATAPIPDAVAEKYRQRTVPTFLSHLVVVLDGVPLVPKATGGRSHIGDGAGGQPILRMETDAFVPWGTGASLTHSLHYEDQNFPNRVGWKEVVVHYAAGVELIESTATAEDRSLGLTRYPDAELQSPPQIRTADLRFRLVSRSQTQALRRDPRVAPGLTQEPPSRPLDPRVGPGSQPQ